MKGLDYGGPYIDALADADRKRRTKSKSIP